MPFSAKPSRLDFPLRRRGKEFSLIHVFFFDPFHGSGKTALGIRENGSPPISKESEETLLCCRKSLAIFDGRGRKSQAIFDGRGRVPRKFIEFSGDNEKKDRRSFFLRKKRSKRGARSKIGLPSLKLFLPTHEWVGKNSFHLSFLYFPRLLRSRRKSVLFLKEKGPEKRSGAGAPEEKKKILDLSFPLRGIRQMKIFLSTHEMGR